MGVCAAGDANQVFALLIHQDQSNAGRGGWDLLELGTINPLGQQSSAINQNGQFVKGVDGVMDQTTYPGSRADIVQAALGH